MSKKLNLKKIKSKKERRTNMYVWRDIQHLKEAFSEYIESEEIDEIITQIKKSGKFEERTGISEEENEAGLCNLAEAIIMHRIEKRDYKVLGKD